MSSESTRRAFLTTLGAGLAGVGAAGVRPAAAQPKALTVAYMPHPIHLNQLDWMRKGAAQLKVDIDAPAIAYMDYVQAMTAQFLGPRNRYHVIWNNDDWGQLFGPFLEPLDEVKPTWPEDRAWMMRHAGKQTAAPFVLTAGVMFYRKDLIAENELPKTFDELVEASKKAQAKGVKWGIMGGSGFPQQRRPLPAVRLTLLAADREGQVDAGRDRQGVRGHGDLVLGRRGRA